VEGLGRERARWGRARRRRRGRSERMVRGLLMVGSVGGMVELIARRMVLLLLGWTASGR